MNEVKLLMNLKGLKLNEKKLDFFTVSNLVNEYKMRHASSFFLKSVAY